MTAITDPAPTTASTIPTPPIGTSASTVDVSVTPDMARDWLTRNKSNRNIRPLRVAQYARDMRAGAWKRTGETIKFDTNSDLLDGQHRLAAVIEAEAVVPMSVTFGLDPDIKHYVDTGAARTPADALRIKGESSPAILAGAARMGYLLETGQRKARMSHAQVFEYIDQHPGLRASADFVMPLTNKVDLGPSTLAYGHYRFNRIDPIAAATFITSLAELTNLGSDDPILRFAHRLRSIKRNNEDVDRRALAVTFLRVWNHWRQGASIQRILLAGPDSPLPELV